MEAHKFKKNDLFSSLNDWKLGKDMLMHDWIDQIMYINLALYFELSFVEFSLAKKTLYGKISEMSYVWSAIICLDDSRLEDVLRLIVFKASSHFEMIDFRFSIYHKMSSFDISWVTLFLKLLVNSIKSWSSFLLLFIITSRWDFSRFAK